MTCADESRSLPDCLCAPGTYDHNGESCVECKKVCETCNNANSCLTCKDEARAPP